MTRDELNKILVEHHFQLISEHNNKRVTTYTYTCSISYLNRFITFNVLNGSDDIYNDMDEQKKIYQDILKAYQKLLDEKKEKGLNIN
jgi:hypothetical protein